MSHYYYKPPLTRVSNSHLGYRYDYEKVIACLFARLATTGAVSDLVVKVGKGEGTELEGSLLSRVTKEVPRYQDHQPAVRGKEHKQESRAGMHPLVDPLRSDTDRDVTEEYNTEAGIDCQIDRIELPTPFFSFFEHNRDLPSVKSEINRTVTYHFHHVPYQSPTPKPPPPLGAGQTRSRICRILQPVCDETAAGPFAACCGLAIERRPDPRRGSCSACWADH